MIKKVESKTNLLEMPRRAGGSAPELTLSSGRAALSTALSDLRAEMDGLTIRLAREYGRASQVTMRAEQISNAVQRLEWALEREHSGPTAG